MKTALMALAALSLASPALAEPLPEEAKQVVIAEVKDELLDGETARWRWPDYNPGADGAYCGWVNAKNRFGAYIGFVPYVAHVFELGEGEAFGQYREGWNASLITMGDDSLDRSVAMTICAEKGYQMDDIPPE